MDDNALPRGQLKPEKKVKPPPSFLASLVQSEMRRKEKQLRAKKRSAKTSQEEAVVDFEEEVPDAPPQKRILSKNYDELKEQIRMVGMPHYAHGSRLLGYVSSKDDKRQSYCIHLLHCSSIDVRFQDLSGISDDEGISCQLCVGSFVFLYTLKSESNTELCLNPELVNESSSFDIGSLVQGFVENSVEHGYMVNVGGGSKPVFVKTNNLTLHEMGDIVICKIVENTKKKYLFAEFVSGMPWIKKKGKTTELKQLQLGVSYRAKLQDRGRVGIAASVGSVPVKIQNMDIPPSDDFFAEYNFGDMLKVVPVYIDSQKQEVYCSMSSGLVSGEVVSLPAEEEREFEGEVLCRQNKRVVGVSDELPCKVFIRTIAPEHLVEGIRFDNFRFKVRYHSVIDGVHVAQRCTDTVQKGSKLAAFTIGQKIQCQVMSFENSRVKVYLNDTGQTGYIPYDHVTDKGNCTFEKAKKYLTEGSKVECRIIELEPGLGDSVILTMKPMMVNAENIFLSYADVKKGDQFCGWVIRIREHVVNVRHFKLGGAILSHNLVVDGVDHGQSLRVGQSFSAFVFKCDPAERQVFLTLRPPSRPKTETLSRLAFPLIPGNPSTEDLKVGQLLKAYVFYIRPDLMILSIPPNAQGMLHCSELNDIPSLSHSVDMTTLYSKGDLVEVRIMNIDKDRKITLTARPSLMDPSFKPATEYNQISVGDTFVGWVDTVNKGACYISSFNGLRAFLPKTNGRVLRFKQAVSCVVESNDWDSDNHKLPVVSLTAAIYDSRTQGDASITAGGGGGAPLPSDLRGCTVSSTVVRKLSDHFEVVFQIDNTSLNGVIQRDQLHDYPSVSDVIFSLSGEGRVFSRCIIVSFKDLESKIELSCKKSCLQCLKYSLVTKKSTVIGFVKEITEIGAFVQVPPATFCIAPKDLNDITYLKKDQTVTGEITEADTEKKRYVISLKPGSKIELVQRLRDIAHDLTNLDRITHNHLLQFGSSQDCVVQSSSNLGCCLTVENSMPGFIPDFLNRQPLAEGQKLSCFVTGYDCRNKRLVLSPCRPTSGVSVALNRNLDQQVLIVHETADYSVGRPKVAKNCFVLISRKWAFVDQPAPSLIAQSIMVRVFERVSTGVYLGVTLDQKQAIDADYEEHLRTIDEKAKFVTDKFPIGSEVKPRLQNVGRCYLNVLLGKHQKGMFFLGDFDWKQWKNPTKPWLNFLGKEKSEMTGYVVGYKELKQQNRDVFHPSLEICLLLSPHSPDEREENFGSRVITVPEPLLPRTVPHLRDYAVGMKVRVILSKVLPETNLCYVMLDSMCVGSISLFELSADTEDLNNLQARLPVGTAVEATIAREDGNRPYMLTRSVQKFELGAQLIGKKDLDDVILCGNKRANYRPDDISDISSGQFFTCYVSQLSPLGEISISREKPTMFSASVLKDAEQFKQTRSYNEDTIFEEELETEMEIPSNIVRKRAKDETVPAEPLAVGWDSGAEDEEGETEEADGVPPVKKSKSEPFNVQLHKPKSEDFKMLESLELAVTANPDRGSEWVKYMHYYRDLDNISQVRAIAERALDNIRDDLEEEKLKVWFAVLELENSMGDELMLEEAFADACRRNNSLKVHIKMAEIFSNSGKSSKADETYRNAVKKFKAEPSVWITYLEFLFKQHKFREAADVMTASFKSLQKKQHVDIISKFAQFEFKYGEIERGVTHFESILSCYPKRTDVWSIYIDMLVSRDQIESARQLFERILCLQFTKYKMRFFFKKWAEFEAAHGTEEQQNYVSQKCIQYVEDQKAKDNDENT